jgi:hypothetical protein
LQADKMLHRIEGRQLVAAQQQLPFQQGAVERTPAEHLDAYHLPSTVENRPGYTAIDAMRRESM